MDENPSNTWTGELVDAYCHIGDPKYGTLSDVDQFLNRLSIKQAVLALGPGIPDLPSLIRSRETYGDRVRYMGIPFGETEAQRRELGELQLKIGISGMRLMPSELEQNRSLIDQLGEAGLCLYAINPFGSSAAIHFLLDWLERYPSGTVASPHFLRARPMAAQVEDVGLFKSLLQHPRYYAIFSRQGGTGTTEPYPHRDLLPWVEEIAELVTWRRILWGSEFPIIYQRNEQPEEARDWLLDLGIRLTHQEQADFYANNTQRLLFEAPPPAMEAIEIPQWVSEQIDHSSTVYLFPTDQIYIPMQTHGILLSRYLEKSRRDPELNYADFIASALSDYAASLNK